MQKIRIETGAGTLGGGDGRFRQEKWTRTGTRD